MYKIPLFKICWREEDIKAVSKVIRKGTHWATGPEVEEFEKKIAEFVGVKYAVAFNSGTSALHVLLLAHDIKEKEVIVPSFTFIATANAVLLAGGIPIFAESDSETYGLDFEDVRKKATKRTKAIIPIHYGGFPAKDIEKLHTFAKENNILLIEDAAESLGAHVNNKMIGSFGESAIFSFCQGKVLTTGEGGAVVTNDEKIYNKVKLLRSHGRVEIEEDYFSSIKDCDYLEVGYNFRLPTMCAALGLSQIDNIQQVINARRKNAKYLTEQLSKIKEIKTPAEIDGHYSVYQMYTIQLPSEEIRDKLKNYLNNYNISSKVYFNPVHLKTIYKKTYNCREGDLPKTELLSKRVLNLPLYPTMSKDELNYIINTIKDFFENEKCERSSDK